MFTLKDRPGVYAMALTWHYVLEDDGVTPDLGSPAVCEGRKRCRVAVDTIGHQFCVAPGHDLPSGMRWL